MIIKYRFINLPIVKRGKESKIGTVGVPIKYAYFSMSKHLKSCKTCNMSLVLLCLTVTTLVCLLYKHVTLRKSKMVRNV